ncbi:putative E3 ubiquitin-protein ligase ARI6 [Notolabrus celidotus]|uniref:putative E3 ubiquitin-protein ligase ARI6 n=1 Tax=Notolabrus celidotus TaxID=1203425 RepID=UPI00148FF3D0|nr:putative E3 ubiquitin-protein ligase ARI6 [Notolabrus celidotus]
MGNGSSSDEIPVAPTPSREIPLTASSRQRTENWNTVLPSNTPGNINKVAALTQRSSTAQYSPIRRSNQEERCYDPEDLTLTFVDGDDDMDFELNEYKSLKTKMSCGHTVTPMSLMNWCQRLLDKGETRFVCGVCPAKWSHEEVYKKALMNPEEIEHFDNTLFKRVAEDHLGVKKCPGCKSFAVRRDLNNLRVKCTVCTADKGRTYQFCWQCLKEWKRPSPYSDRCAEDGCFSQQMEILRTCPEITFEDVKNVTGCPSIRACPTCGVLIEHNRKKCKNITCERCKVKFCFVCLKLETECLKSSTHYKPCFSGVAPRQTAIPVWKK